MEKIKDLKDAISWNSDKREEILDRKIAETEREIAQQASQQPGDPDNTFIEV